MHVLSNCPLLGIDHVKGLAVLTATVSVPAGGVLPLTAAVGDDLVSRTGCGASAAASLHNEPMI